MCILQQRLGVAWNGLASLKKVVCVHFGGEPAQIQLYLVLCFCEGMKAEKTGVV